MQRSTYAALAISLFGGMAAAQGTTSKSSDDNFSWTGKMAAGSWLRVRNLTGEITVERATGDAAEVTGEKRWRRGDPKDVHFEVVKDGSNITICALWGDESSCDARGVNYHRRHHENWGDDDDVSVRFTVKLPKGVKVDVGTVNGSLDVSGAQGEVQAATVNGRVEVATTSGPVSAHTVNGSVRVRMDALTGTDDLEFSTVNGSVTVEVPANFTGEIDMETVNGSLSSDFPLTISGRVNPRHLRATIGNGSRRVELKTVNGSIELKRSS